MFGVKTSTLSEALNLDDNETKRVGESEEKALRFGQSATMRRWFVGLGIILGLGFGLVSFTRQSEALTCSEVRQLSLLYLKMHFSHTEFNDELSKRTLDTFLEAWDPARLYWLESDIKQLRAKYETKIDDMVLGSMDCSAIDEVMNLYSKRFDERYKKINQFIDMKHDFSLDEYLVVDADDESYAKDVKEADERWRQRIKFQLMTLITGADDGDEKKARERLHKRYDLAMKRHQEMTKARVYGVYMNAFSSALDPHSSYMPADDLEDFRIRTRLSLEGIGATLRSEDGFTIVASLVKGGAAEKGGLLKMNDKIIAVAQGDGEAVDVIDTELQEVVKLIRGARGTTVKLTVLREESKQTRKLVVPVVRERIQLTEQQASSSVIEVDVKSPDNKKRTMKVGVLSLPSFYIDFEARQRRLKDYRSSSNDTKRELDKLKSAGVDAVIMDLRSNGGGSLEESIKVAGLFFDQGPVVQVKSQLGDYESYPDRDGKTAYKGPLLVMINRNSASASEIFAGAIQDYQRGIIVGDSHTFGKGTVQNLNDLAPKLGAIKVTVNQFYRASGLSTQLEGVSSDIILPSLVDELEIGEKYYDFALPFEKIKPEKFTKFGLVSPYIEKLKARSMQRVEASKDFEKVREEIATYEENKKERSKISLKIGKEEKPEESEEESVAINAPQDDNIAADIYLQEAIKIAADYALLTEGKTLDVSMPMIADLDTSKEKPSVVDESAVSRAKKK